MWHILEVNPNWGNERTPKIENDLGGGVQLSNQRKEGSL
jgi:hypothetical protein